MNIDTIINKIAVLFDHLNNVSHIHEENLKKVLVKYECKNIHTKNLTLSEIHVIDCIGKHKLSNATFISTKLEMTKGAISKITAKLIDKNFIIANRLENNKKEIYYTLTSDGKQIFAVHKKLHEEKKNRLISILSKYDDNEINTISNFIDDLINEHKD
ncbi:MarR family transcriptional regulator [Clostridium tyrobutyricum]|uniref:MarR family transcriptional regulator n=1 Tax=Clostridium tyrobutyricum TaxID=1519 RepID=UPI0030CB5DBC